MVGIVEDTSVVNMDEIKKNIRQSEREMKHIK